MGRKKTKDIDLQNAEEFQNETLSDSEFSWTAFSLGLVMGILVLGTISSIFAISINKRINGLENFAHKQFPTTKNPSARPLYKKALEIQSAMGALAKTGEVTAEAKKLKGKVEKLSEILKQKTIENDPVLVDLRLQILMEMDKKLAKFQSGSVSEKQNIPPAKISVNDLQDFCIKLQADINGKIEKLEQNLAKNKTEANLVARISAVEKNFESEANLVVRISALEKNFESEANLVARISALEKNEGLGARLITRISALENSEIVPGLATKINALEKKAASGKEFLARISALEDKIAALSVANPVDSSVAIEKLQAKLAILEKRNSGIKIAPESGNSLSELSSQWNSAYASLQDAMERAKKRIDAQLVQGKKLSAGLKETQVMLTEHIESVQRLEEIRRGKEAIYDKAVEEFSAANVQFRQKLAEYEQNLAKSKQTAPIAGKGLSANSVEFSHLSEKLKTRLARSLSTNSVNRRFDFGHIYLTSEASARELRYEHSFPMPFAAEPLVWVVSPENPKWEIYIDSITKSGCEIIIKSRSRISEGEYSLEWMAAGKKE